MSLLPIVYHSLFGDFNCTFFLFVSELGEIEESSVDEDLLLEIMDRLMKLFQFSDILTNLHRVQSMAYDLLKGVCMTGNKRIVGGVHIFEHLYKDVLWKKVAIIVMKTWCRKHPGESYGFKLHNALTSPKVAPFYNKKFDKWLLNLQSKLLT